jgi:hypothetical protein
MIMKIGRNTTVADPKISKRGRGHPPKKLTIHVFWVSNLEFF